MESVKTLCLTGYRSYELGIFQENDPKIPIIKKCIKMELTRFLEQGLEWVLTSGQLGVELWGAEVVSELKEDYPELKLGIIFPFKSFGNQWNEKNRGLLAKASSLADYVNSTSHKEYENPRQLKDHTRFLLEHSGAALLVYDMDAPGKCEFFYKDAKEFQKKYPYEITLIGFDDLQNAIEDSYEF